MSAERDTSASEYHAVIDSAARLLAWTQCPYFKGEGSCDRGCYSEPSCQTDQPSEGWDGAALELLVEALGVDDSDTEAEAA